ncbi:MAG: carotenoid biosynthesis protein [Aureispira sp.]
MSPVPAVIVLMIVYMASLIGFTTPHQQAWYLYYTPYFLLLNLVILLLYQRQWNRYAGFFGGIVLITTALVEGVAVYTNTLYGNYSFGASLGYPIAGVPIILPIYWLIIIGSTAILTAKVVPKSSVGRILIGTGLTLTLTITIQQVANRLNFWVLDPQQLWQYVLVQGVVATLLHFLFVHWKVSSDNRIAGYVYGGLLIFFIGVISFLP